MRGDLPEGMEEIWRSGNYVGTDRRPFARVTVHRPTMQLYTYGMTTTFRRVAPSLDGVAVFNPFPQGIDPTRGDPVTNTYADFLFGALHPPKELPNVAEVSWTRTMDADAAQCTVRCWNTSPLPLGEKPRGRELDRPGWFTAKRGTWQFSGRWRHEPNEWVDMLMPDNVLRVYEGYGYDPESTPEQDPHLTLTGVWLIDDVRLSALGQLVIVCRDAARLLLDHQNFPPVVPEDFYPTSFRAWDEKVTMQSQRQVVRTTTATERLKVTPLGSGNDRWPESAYVGARVYGHSHLHAFDGNPATYWLSVGNATPAYRSSYEYVDFNVHGATFSEIRFTTVGGGYTAYVSMADAQGNWRPGPIMGYHRDGRGRYDEGVPYVARKALGGSEGEHVIRFTTAVKGVHRVRLWLNGLRNFGLPGAKYRAGIREISVRGPVTRTVTETVVDQRQVDLTPGPAGSNPGYVQDFTDIIRLFLAWAGLFWPQGGRWLETDGSELLLSPAVADVEHLGAEVNGRVWGDLMETGTAPLAEISVSAFDKKSLREGIRYLEETIGFAFWVDETGAAQWRLPNIWQRGNWIGGLAELPGRTSAVIELDENQVLMGLDATITSRNVREGIFVGNIPGNFAALVGGYNPNVTGLRRVGGVTDKHFASAEEARVMADLVAVRQMLRYRTDQLRIPAFPGIQIDDQVRIFERVTSEGFYHYVKGISSTNNLATGEWTYDLQTHWLGDDPEGAWIVDRTSLSEVTRAYVDALVERRPEWRVEQ